MFVVFCNIISTGFVVRTKINKPVKNHHYSLVNLFVYVYSLHYFYITFVIIINTGYVHRTTTHSIFFFDKSNILTKKYYWCLVFYFSKSRIINWSPFQYNIAIDTIEKYISCTFEKITSFI